MVDEKTEETKKDPEKTEDVKPKETEAHKKEEQKEEKVEVPKKFESLVKEIETLSVLDLAELVKVLEKKFGVSAAAPVVAAAPAAAPAQAAGPEKSVFNIELTQVGDKKIEVIKAIRDITQKGLKDSKDLVDAAASGAQMVKENVKKEEAEEIQKKFQAAGATVELK